MNTNKPKRKLKQRPPVTPLLIDFDGGTVRWGPGRTKLYKIVAGLLAEGKRAAVKVGRRTMLDVPILDDYFANLPAAEIKMTACAAAAAPVAPSTQLSPVTTTEPARRCRPRTPAPSSMSPADAPPMQPQLPTTTAE